MWVPSPDLTGSRALYDMQDFLEWDWVFLQAEGPLCSLCSLWPFSPGKCTVVLHVCPVEWIEMLDYLVWTEASLTKWTKGLKRFLPKRPAFEDNTYNTNTIELRKEMAALVLQLRLIWAHSKVNAVTIWADLRSHLKSRNLSWQNEVKLHPSSPMPHLEIVANRVIHVYNL